MKCNVTVVWISSYILFLGHANHLQPHLLEKKKKSWRNSVVVSIWHLEDVDILVLTFFFSSNTFCNNNAMCWGFLSFFLPDNSSL